MAEASTILNPGSGGDQVANFTDSTSRVHQEVIIQTQAGTNDPQSVNSSNALPVAQQGAIPTGSNTIGNVGLIAGSAAIGSVNQGGAPWHVDGQVASGGANTGANPVKVGGVFNSGAPVFTNAQIGDLQIDANGNLKVNIVAGANAGGTSSNFSSAFPASGTAVGASDGTNMKPLSVDGSGNLKVNIAAGGAAAATDNAAFTAGTTTGLPMVGVFNDSISALGSGNAGVPRLTASRQLYTVPQANTIGGWTPFRLISAATTNATSVKGSAGSLSAIVCGNALGTVAYLKLFNKASAPTLGTDTPVFVVPIPGNTAGAGVVVPLPAGLSFSTGIAFAVTGLPADTDTTVIAANQVTVSLAFA